jgi:hypothetical protein
MSKFWNPLVSSRRPPFNQYRHIPNYQKTMERVASERDQMLAFLLTVSDEHTTLEQLVTEIGRSATALRVSFDEALFFKWRYFQNLQKACEMIEDTRLEYVAS